MKEPASKTCREFFEPEREFNKKEKISLFRLTVAITGAVLNPIYILDILLGKVVTTILIIIALVIITKNMSRTYKYNKNISTPYDKKGYLKYILLTLLCFTILGLLMLF